MKKLFDEEYYLERERVEQKYHDESRVIAIGIIIAVITIGIFISYLLK